MIEDLEFSALQEKLINIGGRHTTYPYILEHLVSSNPLIKGAPVMVPETVLFSDKKPKCLIGYSMKTNEIRCWPSLTPLQLPRLLKVMMNRYRTRKKPPELRIAASLILSKNPSIAAPAEVCSMLFRA